MSRLADAQRDLIEAAERRGYERALSEFSEDAIEREQELRRSIERNEKLREDLDALRARIAAAPVADIAADGKDCGKSALIVAAARVGYYSGKRVRILVEDE